METKDKKEIAGVIGKIIDEKVAPGLKKLESQNNVIIEQVVKNSEDIEVIKEDFQDMGYTIERIETKIDANIRRQDDASVKVSQLARRVLRLESKKT